MLAIGLLYIALIVFRYVPCIHDLSNTLNMKGCVCVCVCVYTFLVFVGIELLISCIFLDAIFLPQLEFYF